MTVTPPLVDLADVDAVDNVVIFVSDALRFDFLPDEVTELGVTAEAIAPSTFTASSLPSITTGQYPATHGVWMFDDQLKRTPALLSDGDVEVGFDAETVWTELGSAEKPPLQIHGLETETELGELEPPFTHFVHDVGPHAPYGFENGVFESTKQFFREYERRRPRLVELYRRDCHHSAGRFLEIYDRIVDRGLLDETLLVFTSDHGQCLGEWYNGGRFGHGHPMCPETVEIPIVFLGAGLPEGTTCSTVLSGVDLAPTVLSAQRRPVPEHADGTDVWRTVPAPDRKLRSDVWQHLDVGAMGVTGKLTPFAATSVWNGTGGYVFHRKSRAQRVAGLLYDNLLRGYAPAWLANLSVEKATTLVSLSMLDALSYGAPDFSEADARRLVPDELVEGTGRRDEVSLSEKQQSRLRDLGYLQ